MAGNRQWYIDIFVVFLGGGWADNWDSRWIEAVEQRGVRHLCDEDVGASDGLVWSLIRPLPNNFPKRQSNCYSANIDSHPALPRMPHPQTTKGSFLSVRLRRERLTMKHRTLRRSPPHGNRRTPCSRLGTRARNGHSLRLSSVLSYSLCIMIS